MKPGFSKIIAEDYILPDQNARSLPCMTDMAVMFSVRVWSKRSNAGPIS